MPPDSDQTADQVADLQAQLDQSRSECMKPIVMDHLHRAMRAKSNTDKYHEYHALCVICLSYIEDEDLKTEIQKDMERPDTNFSNDIIRIYKAEMRVGVPNYLIFENEYAKLVPRIVRVWLKVQKALVGQGLIPWSLEYPEQLVQNSLLDALITDIQLQKFEQAAHGAQTMTPESNSRLPPVRNQLNEEDEAEEQAHRHELTEEDVPSDENEHDAEEKQVIPEVDPSQTGERIAEPEPDRFSGLDIEPHIPMTEENDEGDEDCSDEEIENGAEAIKKLPQERTKRVRRLRAQ